jgi:hypothetical protein
MSIMVSMDMIRISIGVVNVCETLNPTAAAGLRPLVPLKNVEHGESRRKFVLLDASAQPT